MSIEIYKITPPWIAIGREAGLSVSRIEEQQLKQAEHTRFIGRKRRLSLVQMGEEWEGG